MTTDYFKPVPFSLFRTDKKAFGDALCRSFRETGFAVVSGHTVDPEIIARNLEATKAFFALPDAAKLKYDGRAGGGQLPHRHLRRRRPAGGSRRLRVRQLS